MHSISFTPILPPPADQLRTQPHKTLPVGVAKSLLHVDGLLSEKQVRAAMAQPAAAAAAAAAGRELEQQPAVVGGDGYR